MDQFTNRVREALSEARATAVDADHQFLEPLHVLQALLAQDGGAILPLLRRAGADTGKLQADIAAALERMPSVQGQEGDLHASAALARVLNLSGKLARKRGDTLVSSEILLLAAAGDKGEHTRLVKEAGVTRHVWRRQSTNSAAGKTSPTRAPRNCGAPWRSTQ